ncbi:hypothetical protein B0I72DRAFT_138207 [Yarrowia lipolytica]|nr:hypothetical protein B0I71DRAFT_130571 [Yarrowia lipolytica]RDW32405.1 hypothetical protein B0I72DRAFT_138207 [Yarrowia lipolytica]RDW41796.1 hypothetical protein B0I73DRAFT_128020 [Yarrowia lipolytica]RDW46015.1 hypothetical protein B0I74DRAFT_137752 [Yarrowia lipolytica]RDW54062.1 hypothetical protein B0I75DRAFT_135232 [Yarrowia lipolytica]
MQEKYMQDLGFYLCSSTTSIYTAIMVRERSGTVAYTPKKQQKPLVDDAHLSSAEEDDFKTPESAKSKKPEASQQEPAVSETPVKGKAKKITFDEDGMSAEPIVEKKKVVVEESEDDSDDAPEEETLEDGQEKTLAKQKEQQRLAALEKAEEKKKRREANEVLAKQAKAKKDKLEELRRQAREDEEEDEEEEEDEDDDEDQEQLPLEVLEALERSKNMPVEEPKKPKKRVFEEVEEEIKKGPVSVRVLKKNKSKLPPKAEGATTVGRMAFLNRPSIDRRQVKR